MAPAHLPPAAPKFPDSQWEFFWDSQKFPEIPRNSQNFLGNSQNFLGNSQNFDKHSHIFPYFPILIWGNLGIPQIPRINSQKIPENSGEFPENSGNFPQKMGIQKKIRSKSHGSKKETFIYITVTV